MEIRRCFEPALLECITADEMGRSDYDLVSALFRQIYHKNF